MLKLWGRTSSSNVMKVLWLCEELAIPYERIDAGGEYGRTTEPFYLAMNPNSRVPTIEEPDGFTLWESNSILRYLVATRAAGDPLHPAEPRARANVERWMDWQLASLNAPMVTVFFTYVRIPEAKRDYPPPPGRGTRRRRCGGSSTGSSRAATTSPAACRWPTSCSAPICTAGSRCRSNARRWRISKAGTPG